MRIVAQGRLANAMLFEMWVGLRQDHGCTEDAALFILSEIGGVRRS
jgi:hypothetical protein